MEANEHSITKSFYKADAMKLARLERSPRRSKLAMEAWMRDPAIKECYKKRYVDFDAYGNVHISEKLGMEQKMEVAYAFQNYMSAQQMTGTIQGTIDGRTLSEKINERMNELLEKEKGKERER